MGYSIIAEDVIQVANDLNFKPTQNQIDQIIELYPSEQEADSKATWNLVIEQLLYSLEVEQIKPN